MAMLLHKPSKPGICFSIAKIISQLFLLIKFTFGFGGTLPVISPPPLNNKFQLMLVITPEFLLIEVAIKNEKMYL